MSAVPRYFPIEDIARTNRFAVAVFPPSIAGLSSASFGSTFIESVEMPSMTIQTEEYEIDGKPTIKVPLKRTPAGQVTINIRLEENGKSRNLFKDWLAAIVSTQTNTTYYRKYYSDIVGRVTITQLDQFLNPTFSVTLLNAYPVTVDTIQYDWGDMDNYVKQSVTIAYYDELYN